MNKNSEAVGAQAAAEITKGDSRILLARDAIVKFGLTDATARVSLRSSGLGTLAQFRETLEKESARD